MANSEGRPEGADRGAMLFPWPPARQRAIPDIVNENRVFVRPLADVDFIEPMAGGHTVHYNAAPQR